MVKALIKIPIRKETKKWLFSKFPDRVIDGKYFDLKGLTMGKSILGFANFFISESSEKYQPNIKDFPEDCLDLIVKFDLMKYGFNENNSKYLGRFFDKLCKNDLVIYASIIGSMPMFSRSAAIEITFQHFGITAEDYDLYHFRRYFDRYHSNFMGNRFDENRRRLTQFFKEYIKALVP